jgi:LPXTG-motif cell wall-anchored protein
VYLRSIAPLPLTGDIIINKDVTTNNVAVSELNTNNVLDQTVFTFKIWNAVSNGEGWVKGTTEFAIGAPFTASEATPRVVHNVPYGNYIVEEVGYNGYTPAYLTDFVTVPSNDNQSNVAYFENALNPLLNVTFDPQNGESSTSIGGIASGATVALPPNPSNGASTFNGWNTASDGSGLTFTELTPVLNNITVYAQWVSETITTTRNRTSTVVVPVEPTPAGPVIIPVIDEQVPAAPLPKTGGLDPSFLYGLGALLATGGLVIRKRKDK